MKFQLMILILLLSSVGFAHAGYGSGTPGYYDPWTYYGGYDRYYNNRVQEQQRQQILYPLARRGMNIMSNTGNRGNQPRPFNPSNNGNSMARSSSNFKPIYYSMYDDNDNYDYY